MKKQSNQLLVIGCGTMGHSIALQAAWSGWDVFLFGLTDKELVNAQKEIHLKLKTLMVNGMVDDTESIKRHIFTTTNLEEVVSSVHFVIEAVPEILNLKIDLFNKLDSLCSKDVILASNTSGLLPSEISAGMQHPQRFLITHFWNPAHLVPLVEVVGNAHTTQATIDKTFTFLQSMGKKPVHVKKELGGFIGNRLQFALFREAQYLLQEGVASKEDIDAAVRYGIGRRLPETGPLESADMGGLDVFAAIAEYLQLCNISGPLPVLQDLVANGHYGLKTNEGFYTWNAALKQEINERREGTLIEFLRKDNQIGVNRI